MSYISVKKPLFDVPTPFTIMSNYGHYVLNTMYYLFKFTGTATYTKCKQANGEYVYVPRLKNELARYYTYIAGKFS